MLLTKTLEFPVVLEPEQQEKVEFYLNRLKSVWNIGLARLEELDTFTGYYNKDTKSRNLCCPINWEYRRYWLDEQGNIIDKPTKQQKKEREFIEAPFCRVIADATAKSYLKQLPEVKTVVPALEKGKKGKTAREWMDWSNQSGQPIVITTSRLLNFRGVKVDEYGCGGFSCPLIPSVGDESFRPYYQNLKAKWDESYYQWCRFCEESGLQVETFDGITQFLPGFKPPLIQTYKHDASGGLGVVIKKENLSYREDLLEIPYKFRAGTIKSLSTSWQEYEKSRRKQSKIFRGKPKFKRSSEKLKTVIHPNPKKAIVPIGKDQLRGVPQLGVIKVPGLDKRWVNPDGTRPEIATFKICKEASGWYVQLTGKLERSLGLREGGKAIAADPGLLNWITFDDGRVVENPRYLRQGEAKLARLQKQLAHKRIHRLILWLNHPDRTVEDIQAVRANISAEDCRALMSCKSEPQGIELIGSSRWNSLKYKAVPPSQAIQNLEQKIAKHHERLRRARRAFAHRLSTWLVRNFDVFICEDGLQDEKLRHQAQMKLGEGDVAQRNQKKAKSGLAKSLSDAAHGQFLEMCEQKFKAAGKTFLRHPAKGTTKECPICGTDNDMGANFPGQRYRCADCNWEAGRDQKPGILMLLKAYDRGQVSFEMLSPPTKSAVIYRENWRARQGGCKKRKNRSKR